VKSFKAKNGTVFGFHEDLTGAVEIRGRIGLPPVGEATVLSFGLVMVPVDDMFEFAAHIGKTYASVLAGREVSGFLRGFLK
jgi:hypothetical protein